MIDWSTDHTLTHAGRSCDFDVVIIGDEVDYDFSFEGVVDGFGPDESEVIRCSQSWLERHVEGVVLGPAVVGVGDFGRRGIDVRVRDCDN